MSIIVAGLAFLHPDKEWLFEGLDFSLAAGDKAALVGNNGAGKSTLLKIIAGKQPASMGTVTVSEQPWYVPQHLGEYDHLSVARALGIDSKLMALHAILSGDTDPDHFTTLNDDWEIEQSIVAAFEKWNIGHISTSQLMGNLSGGEKTKVFLAGIDIFHPAIILLDEPSNHLDTESLLKLYQLITSGKATMLVVSHDRTLLNLLPKTMELSAAGIELFGGNFEFYQEQKKISLDALQSQLDEQSKSLKKAKQKARNMNEQRQKKEARGKAHGQTDSLPRIIAGGLKNKAEQSTARLLDAHNEKNTGILENIKQLRSNVEQYKPLKIDIGASALHRGKILFDANRLGFSYGHQLLWQPLTFQVRSGERVRIQGTNGAGKTTLLKIITGDLASLEGKIVRADFQYLYLDQDYSIINHNLTVYEQVLQYNSSQLLEHELKALLTHAQFTQDAWNRKCAALSGGEKMKLSLCCLAVSNHVADMLILDEPTNNLDVKSIEVLTGSIKDYRGTLIVISHDEYFINEIEINKVIILSN